MEYNRTSEFLHNSPAEHIFTHDSISADNCRRPVPPYILDTIPCDTIFYDRKAIKEINIFSSMSMPWYKSEYHIDPHLQFCAGDSRIVSTTTVMDCHADVAFTPVETFPDRCREFGIEIITSEHILGTGAVMHAEDDEVHKEGYERLL